jgi:multidrug efflux pump subunit AcrA (membrane-fusion protein)
MCVSVCAVTNGGDAFSITTPTSTGAANAAAAVVAATTDLANAQTALTNSQTALTTAQTTVTNAQTAVVTAQAALTAAQTALANALVDSATLSGVGTSAIFNGVNTATCLYDFLLIAGARDSTNVEADRFCGNALNPAIIPVAASVQVCSKLIGFTFNFCLKENDN